MDLRLLVRVGPNSGSFNVRVICSPMDNWRLFQGEEDSDLVLQLAAVIRVWCSAATGEQTFDELNKLSVGLQILGAI